MEAPSCVSCLLCQAACPCHLYEMAYRAILLSSCIKTVPKYLETVDQELCKDGEDIDLTFQEHPTTHLLGQGLRSIPVSPIPPHCHSDPRRPSQGSMGRRERSSSQNHGGPRARACPRSRASLGSEVPAEQCLLCPSWLRGSSQCTGVHLGFRLCCEVRRKPGLCAAGALLRAFSGLGAKEE